MTTTADAPPVGELVRVRGQQWVVSRSRLSEQARDDLPGRTLVTLTSVSDDDLGAELTVAWDVEPGRDVLPGPRLPQVTVTRVGRAESVQGVPRRDSLGHGRERR